MSSEIAQEEAAALVKRATEMTSGYSYRKAGALMGVSQTHAKKWRDWVERGADPSKLPTPEAETIQRLEDYLAIAEEIETRRRALHLAADRLDELAAQLRAEATSAPEARKGGTVSRRLASRGQPPQEGTGE